MFSRDGELDWYHYWYCCINTILQCYAVVIYNTIPPLHKYRFYSYTVPQQWYCWRTLLSTLWHFSFSDRLMVLIYVFRRHLYLWTTWSGVVTKKRKETNIKNIQLVFWFCCFSTVSKLFTHFLFKDFIPMWIDLK